MFNPIYPGSIRVIINDDMCIRNELKQYKFPKSRKKRIRKKWSKRMVNYRLEKVKKIYKFDNTVVMCREDAERL